MQNTTSQTCQQLIKENENFFGTLFTFIKFLVEKNIVDKYSSKTAKLHGLTEAHIIKNEQDCELAIELYLKAKKAEELIEEVRKTIKTPYLFAIEYLDSATKKITDKLRMMQTKLGDKITSYCVSNDKKMIKSELGSAITQEKTHWEIIDYADIPPEIFVNRTQQIHKALAPRVNELIKSGMNKIPGVRIFPKTSVRVTKNKS